MTFTFTSLSTTRALSRVLWLDAAACLAIGAGLVALAGPLGGATGLPVSLLTGAGLLLLPVAALIGYAAMRPSRGLLRLVVAGNLAWAAASLALVLFALATMNGWGAALVLTQGAAVAGFAALEARGAAATGEMA